MEFAALVEELSAFELGAGGPQPTRPELSLKEKILELLADGRELTINEIAVAKLGGIKARKPDVREAVKELEATGALVSSRKRRHGRTPARLIRAARGGGPAHGATMHSGGRESGGVR